MYIESKVKELITGTKFSVAELARIVGVSYQAMHNICNGKSTPSLDNLEKLANIFNVSMDIFFDRNIQDSAKYENRIGHNVSGQNVMVHGDITISECKKEIEHLSSIICEKDTQIGLLKDNNNMLRELLSNKEKMIEMMIQNEKK